MAERLLTVRLARALGNLADVVHLGRPITRMGPSGEPEWGVARAFTHDGGGFLTDADDIRDGYVWISGGSGLFERWWKVSELLEAYLAGEAAFDYKPVP